MKVLVSVKRAIDYNVRIQIKPDGSGVVENGVKHSMNPFDEIAVEQAMRWKEAGSADEVVAVTIGPEAAKEQLRSALAFGCDRAIRCFERVLQEQQRSPDRVPLKALETFDRLVPPPPPSFATVGIQERLPGSIAKSATTSPKREKAKRWRCEAEGGTPNARSLRLSTERLEYIGS